TVCLNPTLQKTLSFSSITSNAVNRTKVHRFDASGKGINVTRVLTQLGKKVVHLTHLGGDLKPLFLSLCEQDGLNVEWVESESQIRFCYTMLTENDAGTTELIETPEPVAAGTELRLLEKFDDILTQPDLKCLIISGTKARGYSNNVIPTLVRKAKEKKLFVILDIKGDDLLECLKYEPDIIKPNLDEFINTFRLGINGSRDLIFEIAQKYKCRIILTNGSQKILVIDKENYYEVDVTPVKAVNTTGCGDSFTAGLAAALLDKADFNTAISEGIRCGALNVGLVRPGVIK
ncbi:MAG: PfkB family carbohydrate kinase, partial [Treponema sp.]|nr:PfkB family carbohydrate kinase [Treponema sp.]